MTVDKGYFSVLLGEGSAVGGLHPDLSTLFSGADSSDRFVEVAVKNLNGGTDLTTIKPRLRLMTSPYAFAATHALYADKLVNATNASVVNVAGAFVGINKSAPSVALDVAGAAAVSGTLSAGTLSAGAATVSGTLTAGVATVSGTLSAGAAAVSGTLSAGAATVSGTLSTTTLTATNVTASGTISGNGTIPVGGIILWSGSIVNIPAGWALCNGQVSNGQVTPNLTDRFVVGAGSSYTVAVTGGSTSTTLTTSQLPSHTHPYKDGYYTEKDAASKVLSGGGSDYLPTYVSGSGSVDNDNDWIYYRMLETGSTGQNLPVTILPPYFALAYIMRVK